MRAPKKKGRMISTIPENVMPGAEPIFINQGEKGFLFLHGFTGSPYEGRDFAEYFGQRGYTVWVPLLPGHGTHPRDLLQVTWQDWYLKAREQLARLQRQCKKVVVVGQSMGGALALHLAAHNRVDALVTLAGFVFLKDWRIKLLPMARNFIRYQHKSKGPDIRSQQAKRKSASYLKYPVQSVAQLMQLIDHVRDDLMDVHVPLFLIHSRQDHVVPYENMNYIFNHVSSKMKQTLTVENSFHIISVDYDKEMIFQAIEKFVKPLI